MVDGIVYQSKVPAFSESAFVQGNGQLCCAVITDANAVISGPCNSLHTLAAYRVLSSVDGTEISKFWKCDYLLLFHMALTTISEVGDLANTSYFILKHSLDILTRVTHLINA